MECEMSNQSNFICQTKLRRSCARGLFAAKSNAFDDCTELPVQPMFSDSTELPVEEVSSCNTQLSQLCHLSILVKFIVNVDFFYLLVWDNKNNLDL